MNAVLWDLGKVLLDWDPRYFYREVFGHAEAAMERFLAEVLTMEWVRELDAGKPLDQAIAERCAAHPHHAQRIALWKTGWPKMLRGSIPGSVEILAELKARGARLYALSNFSAETWPIARERYDYLGWFEDVVISGDLGITKPDPRIYALAIERCRLDPRRTVFIDDTRANVAAAQALGMHGLHFTGADRLRTELTALGLLPARAARANG